MPKLLTIARKLRTLSRRIVTDAGGAPCCCQPDEACPCDPALVIAPFRAETCINGLRGSVVASSPSRIAIVRMQWAINWEAYSETLRGTPNFTASAQRGLSTGVAQWCVVHVGGWILSGATSVFEYQAAGTRRQSFPDDQSLNLTGAEALQFPIGNLGRLRNFRDSWGFYAPAEPPQASVAIIPRIFAPVYIDPQDRVQCVGLQTYGIGASERFEFAFSSGLEGGAAMNTYAFSDTRFGGIERRTASVEDAWTIRYLTCEIGGPDQLQREPGCSNCGDRAKLEPFV